MQTYEDNVTGVSDADMVELIAAIVEGRAAEREAAANADKEGADHGN